MFPHGLMFKSLTIKDIKNPFKIFKLYNINIKIINSEDDFISTVDFTTIKVVLLKAIFLHFVHIKILRRMK